ncbi:MlaA family lipoprotein [Vibrio chagasii]|nr:MlaA family lipoprotein [Vibrio chagasii]
MLTATCAGAFWYLQPANLDEPSSMMNNLIMGNGEKASWTTFNRFWINSPFGLLGLIDIASEAGQ